MVSLLKNSRYMQYIAAMTGALMSASGSTYSVWASPSLPTLQSDNSPMGKPVSDEQGSWIASLFLLGIMPGALIAGWTIESIGRKKTLLLSGLLFFIPWLIIIFTRSIWLLYVARLISGMGSGMSTITCSIYNGEIADNDIRGKLGTSFTILKYTGSLLVLAVGPFVSYSTLGVICITIPILFLCSFVFMPESPYYLMKVSRKQEAEKNLRTLSGKGVKPEFIGTRLKEIESCIMEDMRNKTTVWEFFSNKDYRKPIFIIIGIKSLQQLCGQTAMDSYMITIIELTLSDSGISSDISSVIFASVQLPAVLIASFLVDRIGRKPLLMISTLGCIIALFIEGGYFYFQDVIKADVSPIKWLPTFGIALYLVMVPVGIFTLPYILMGELFPTNIKGIAVSAMTVYGGALAFLVTKFFKPLVNTWGVHSVFWMFAIICVLGLIFVAVFLPETKGKSFSEIQSIMKNKKILN